MNTEFESRINLLFSIESKGRLWLLSFMMIPVYLLSVYLFYLSFLLILNKLVIFIQNALYSNSNDLPMNHYIFHVPFLVIAVAIPFVFYYRSRKKIEANLTILAEDTYPEIYKIYNNLWNSYDDFRELGKKLGYIPQLWSSNEGRSPYIFIDNNGYVRIVIPQVWIDELSQDLKQGDEKTTEACLLHEASHLIDDDITPIELAQTLMRICWWVLPLLCIYMIVLMVGYKEYNLFPLLFIILTLPISYLTLFRAAQRARELHADIRTCIYQRTEEVLRKLLTEIRKKVDWRIATSRKIYGSSD